MKTVLITFFIMVSTILILSTACKRTTNCASGGGKGGSATLVVTPVHFGLNVDSCKVFIKYGATETPANNIYDDSVKCLLSDTTPVAVFTHLTNGQYYIFGNGYHKAYYTYVEGGVSLCINVQDTVTYQLPTSAYNKF